MQNDTISVEQNQELIKEKAPEKSTRKFIIVLSIILLLTLIFTVVYLILSKKSKEKPEATTSINTSETSSTTTTTTLSNIETEPNAEWTTYQHEDFNFQYPDDWTLKSEGGEPYVYDDASRESSGGEGFRVVVENDNWEFVLTYGPYSDVMGVKPLVSEDIVIQDILLKRQVYTDALEVIDYIDDTVIIIVSIADPENANLDPAYTQWGRPKFSINDKYFSIDYIPKKVITYGDAQESLDMLDQISMSLSVE